MMHSLDSAVDMTVHGMQCWLFFKQRIAVEEEQLLVFFGPAFAQYKQSVPTCMPFIA